jgi:ABC-type multidrug transport system fused ATPase/permease subunit
MLGKEKERPKISKEGLKKVMRIFRYIRPYRIRFIVGLLMLSLSSIIFMIFPGAAGEMANTANGTPRFDQFTVKDYGIVFLVILVIQGLLSYFRAVLFAQVSERGMADIRKELYASILYKPVAFYEERRVGELTSRITTDVEQLQTAFSITLAEFLRQVVTLIAGVAILGWLAPKLSMVMLLTFPFIVVLAIFFGKYIRKMSKQRQDFLAGANTIVEETLQNFIVVKSFTNEWFEKARYARSIDEIVSISIKFAKLRGIFFIFIITVLFGGIFFILWRGALMVEAGTMQVGDLFSFIIYTGIIGAAIASLGALYTSLAGAVGATERILEILDEAPEYIYKENNGENIEKMEGDIRYEQVQFSYPGRPDVQVLKGVSLHIPQGARIALVGASGSGKSTLVQLLMRFYSPNQGRITIGNESIDSFDLLSYRKNFAIVPQEVVLFGGTIRENIAYGKPDAHQEEIEAAAQQANALDFILDFPEGFDTLVGERGIKLSGGQKQRIAIARALLKNPAFLILDEATSSLDAESERVVQEALNALMVGRTSIIIAHRLATIREVDQIYVIDKGEIIETGTHDELLNKENGAYAQLARLQFDLS